MQAYIVQKQNASSHALTMHFCSEASWHRRQNVLPTIHRCVHISAHDQVNLPALMQWHSKGVQAIQIANESLTGEKSQSITWQKAGLNGESGRSGQNMLKKTKTFLQQITCKKLLCKVTHNPSKAFQCGQQKKGLEKCVTNNEKFSFSILSLTFFFSAM